ncbi:hypothetical protein [Paludibacterium paludis]|uniref:Uncharacterized protein n=1 Tax=Paludibacterium paludis TaxID=1225769 RepID=A0A918P344_9NEIS|nr:hypothetical protein [Paludibacterium paludis]GGY13750.1 hypothetical protein GCM10011289_16370 [Paludibacterium paludis]
MRHIMPVVVLSVLVAAPHVCAATAASFPLSLLPGSTPVQARVMKIGLPIEAQRIALRFQAAIADQPEWANTYLAHAKPDQPLPYHPNFRVTEKEYAYLQSVAKKPQLVQVASIRLSTERLPNGALRLVTQPSTVRINGFIIAPDATSATTPLARLTEVNRINNQDKDSATGRWTGTQWQHKPSAAEPLLAMKLAIGKRIDNGDGIIYFSVRNSKNGRNDIDYEALLFPVGK